MIAPGDRLGDAIHVGVWEAGSPEWNDARRRTLNGSEIAAVMGLSPYESAFSLWHRKAGNVADIEQTDVMYWGNQLEPIIRDEYNLRHGTAFAPAGLFHHHQRTWQGGGPDGIHNGELLEVKTARFDEEWGDEGTDEVPIWYRAQALWYADVFGYDVCHFAVLIAGSDYREYRVEYNAAEVELMRLKAREFLDTLRAGKQPAIDGHSATYQTVRELHPMIEPESIEIPADIAEPYLRALAAVKDAEDEKRRCAALVSSVLGNAKDAYYQGQRIASRQAKAVEGSIPYLVAARGVAHFIERGSAA